MSGMDIERLSDAQRHLAAIDTPAEAAQFADYASAYAAAVKAANYGFEVQQQAAEVRIRAERRLGELLADTVHHNGGGSGPNRNLLPEGMSRDRSSRAQKLARITPDDFETYLANSIAAEKELSLAGALKLLPINRKPDRASIAAVYTAPPIDVELARREGMEASDERAELFITAIQDALAHLATENPEHAFVWARHHGIEDDGTIGDEWTFAAIAARLGVTREVIAGRYYRASHHIQQRLVVAAFNRIAELMVANRR